MCKDHVQDSFAIAGVTVTVVSSTSSSNVQIIFSREKPRRRLSSGPCSRSDQNDDSIEALLPGSRSSIPKDRWCKVSVSQLLCILDFVHVTNGCIVAVLVLRLEICQSINYINQYSINRCSRQDAERINPSTTINRHSAIICRVWYQQSVCESQSSIPVGVRLDRLTIITYLSICLSVVVGGLNYHSSQFPWCFRQFSGFPKKTG